MLLSESQRNRFVRIIDNLTVYANEKLGIVAPRALQGSNGGLDAQAQGRVMKRLWENPSLIDDFLADNWEAFDKRDVNDIARWSESLTGYFTLGYLPDGRLAFIRDGFAFVVRGISREIDTMMPYVPCMVKAMIVPFDGCITYTVSIEAMNISIGPNIRESLAEELTEISSDGKVVESADELADAIAEIEAESESRMLREVVESAENVLAATEPIAGTHRGPLAGLSGEKRGDALEAHYQEFDDDDFPDFDDPRYLLSSVSRSGRPKRAAADLLGLMKKDELQGVIVDCALPIPIMMKKADLISALIGELRNPYSLSALAEPVPEPFLLVLERIVEANGFLFIPNGKLDSIEEVMPPYEPLLFLFHHKEGYTYVIPDEFVEAAKKLDFVTLRERAEQRENVGKLASAAVNLRGIVPLYEFILDCRAMLPELTDDEHIIGNMMEALVSRPLFALLMTEDDTYLLDRDLAFEYVDANPDVKVPQPRLLLVEGELDEDLNWLLDMQADKPPYPIDPEMLDFPVMAIWRVGQPAALALQAFFDENVPDGADDYAFADNMLLRFVDEVKRGAVGADALDAYMDILEDEGFPLDEAHIQQFLDLLMQFMNTQPVWPNNGWPPVELIDADFWEEE